MLCIKSQVTLYLYVVSTYLITTYKVSYLPKNSTTCIGYYNSTHYTAEIFLKTSRYSFSQTRKVVEELCSYLLTLDYFLFSYLS